MAMVNQSEEWRALQSHFSEIGNLHISEMFTKDPRRVEKLSMTACDLYIDYSKSWINPKTIKLLIDLANYAHVKYAIKAMFDGEKINTTEQRSVLHVALRNTSNTPIVIHGTNVMDDVNAELAKMRAFTHAIHSGAWLGYTGKKIKNIVNIGIGGSDLGPVMAYEALKPYSDRSMTFRFVSNVDGAHFQEAVRDLSPEETLFIVASKTFTTQETMTNAESAKRWIILKLQNAKAVAKHFVALSTNTDGVEQFGIDPTNMFKFWDWVGGRYSLTSAIGLSVMLAIGADNFDALREGFHEMDMHFKETPFEKNAPLIMAMIGVWYNNFFHTDSYALLPYSQYLSRFPAYFQQGDMESNGKSITKDGEHVTYETGPIIWGEPGTNGQHAFYQLLHQGTRLVPCDFIGFAKAHEEMGDHQVKLMAHMIAQSKTLAFGGKLDNQKDVIEDPIVTAQKAYVGNRPSITILAKQLTPKILGELIALYEHKIFVQGTIWNINSFDQMGVELGKKVASHVLKELFNEKAELKFDSSTNTLIRKFHSLR